MDIKPVITEKTTELAKSGKYVFRVSAGLTKNKIKDAIHRIFGVDVVKIRTIKEQGEVKRSLSSRKKRVVMPSKKAIVVLKDKQTIDIFETKKNKKK